MILYEGKHMIVNYFFNEDMGIDNLLVFMKNNAMPLFYEMDDNGDAVFPKHKQVVFQILDVFAKNSYLNTCFL